jgi:hypothetical protein
MAKKIPRVSAKVPKLRRPSRASFKSFKVLVTGLLLLSIILLGGAGYVWYKNILTDSDRVFYGMLSKSLQTDSVSRTVTQTSSLRNVTQTYNLTYRPTPIAESETTIEQVGENRETNSVTTRSIGTKDVDYVQYTDIQITNVTGKPETKEILGQWAKRDKNTETGEAPQLLSEALFMFVPFGNLASEKREELVSKMRENKSYSFKEGKLEMSGLRPVMTYEVAIKPKALVEVLGAYVQETGIGDASQLDPASYEQAENVHVRITVDLLSRHLKEMTFIGDTRKETYSSYGVKRDIQLPKDTISISDLQTRLQKLQ